jgi:hypothetical protein
VQVIVSELHNTKKYSEMDSFEKFSPCDESVQEFIKRFEMQRINLLEDVTDKKKAAMLASALPRKIFNQLQSKVKPRDITEMKYGELSTTLIGSYSTKKSTITCTTSFLKRTRREGESFENFATDLIELASKCEFSSCCLDRILRDVFISGLNHKLVPRLTLESEGKKFQEVLEASKSLQQTENELYNRNSETVRYNDYRSNYETRPNTRNHRFEKRAHTSGNQRFASNNNYGRNVNNNSIQNRSQRQQTNKHSYNENRKCHRCNRSNHSSFECRFKDAQCFACGKTGHIKQCCRTKTNNNERRSSNQQQKRSNRIELENRNPESEQEEQQQEELDHTDYIRVNRVAARYQKGKQKQQHQRQQQQQDQPGFKISEQDFPPLGTTQRRRWNKGNTEPAVTRNRFEGLKEETFNFSTTGLNNGKGPTKK